MSSAWSGQLRLGCPYSRSGRARIRWTRWLLPVLQRVVSRFCKWHLLAPFKTTAETEEDCSLLFLAAMSTVLTLCASSEVCWLSILLHLRSLDGRCFSNCSEVPVLCCSEGTWTAIPFDPWIVCQRCWNVKDLHRLFFSSRKRFKPLWLRTEAHEVAWRYRRAS